MSRSSVLSGRKSPGVASEINGAAVGARNPVAARTRRPLNILILVLLVIVAGVGGGYLYSTAGEKYAVVATIGDVAIGETIERTDLTIVEVAGDVSAVSAERIDTVVGQRAAVGLVGGTLVQRAMLTDGPSLPAGQAQVGVAVKPGQVPAEGLLPGDVVTVLQLPSQQALNADGADAKPTLIVEGATVIASVPQAGQSMGWTVTLQVPIDAAAAVASASGVGLAALVRVAGS